MTKQIDTILEREMSRKEFLSILGLSMASVMGFSTIIRLLSGKSIDPQPKISVSSGYSSGTYGGHK